jgi:hypothetical protein
MTNFSSPLARAAPIFSKALLGRPVAAIPQHHRAAAVLALGDGALEVAIVERMILDLHGQAAIGRIH